MTVKFELGVTPASMEDFVQCVRLADECGIAAIGVADSQSLFHETWGSCALAAMNSKNILIGPWVTNPVTRHLAVTASAAMTLDDISEGRAFLGIGPGDSAIYNLGLQPPSLGSLERPIKQLRELLEQGSTDLEGSTAKLTWGSRHIPIGIPVSGPKGFHMAGRLADIVWVALGLVPEIIQEAQEVMRAGAEEAGRSLDDIDVWWYAPVGIGESRRKAIDAMKGILSTVAFVSLRFTLVGKFVPDDVAESVRQFISGYRSVSHASPADENPNVKLMERLGLTDYFADRFAIAGTPQECAQQIKDLEPRGVSQFMVPVVVADKTSYVKQLRDELMPLV